ncbi:nuclease-related domain-containing protein [Bacillus sp. B-jedd]|uniref:nuclease-related domain-containing protein n=1 Tax=Bacillus sp. B-jedd TaxID=1476857 RepID=UPI001E51013E|nr:nuclease-related domain-containing protein [Bacillus sp. B-jedd]
MKERKTPIRLLKGEALLRNISPKSPAKEEIQSDIARQRSGYWGEKQLDYQLTLLPDDEYVILNDLRLPFKTTFFQIDCLVLTRRVLYVIESKTIKGILFFDSKFDQLIRTQGEDEEAFEDPIAQAKNHIIQLKALLAPHFPEVPFDYLASIGSPKTLLKSDSSNIPRVCHSYNTVHKLTKLEKHYRKDILTMDQVMDIARLLLQLHTPWNGNILTNYSLTYKDYVLGIFCPICNRKLAYRQGKWECNSCNTTNKDAYIRKIFDYFLLREQQISNAAFRVLTGLPNGNASYQFLQKLNLPSKGTGKGKIYLAPCPMEDYEQFIKDLIDKKKKVTKG